MGMYSWSDISRSHTPPINDPVFSHATCRND